MKNNFLKGISNAIPIALGYLSVSFGFGILAVKSGLSITAATIISATNLTSAGQAAGIAIIAEGGGLLEMALAQLTIYLRYALMAISLSQNLSDSFNFPKSALLSFGITDEIFAVAVSRPKKVTPSYMAGLIFISFLGWTGGTFLGASAGKLLPAAITNAMAATTLQTIIAYIKLQITNFCLNLLKFVVIYLAFIVTAY